MENEDFLKFVIDWKDYDTEQTKKAIEIHQQQLKDAAQRRIDKEEIERCRVLNLECPCCKAIEKNHFVDREHNGIYGGGSRSWINQEYIICLSCGVHYTDLNKGK